MRDKDKRKVKWNSVLSIEDISPRRKAEFIYVLLYTNLGISVCTSETIGQRLCLFQPYEMKGYVNFCKGGTYLVLEKAKEVEGKNYSPSVLRHSSASVVETPGRDKVGGVST